MLFNWRLRLNGLPKQPPEKPPTLCEACYQIAIRLIFRQRHLIQSDIPLQRNAGVCQMCQYFWNLSQAHFLPQYSIPGCSDTRNVIFAGASKSSLKRNTIRGIGGSKSKLKLDFQGDLRVELRGSPDGSHCSAMRDEDGLLDIDRDYSGGIAYLPAKLNFDTIKTWMNTCTQDHAHGGRGTMQRRLRLVDCETRKVVLASENSQYIALSYFWVEPTATELLGDTLVASLPATIEDSILLTRMLGFRYLWVDRYCINRHDLEDVFVQCSQIKRIYIDSELTIIARVGPYYGLPGVHANPRRLSLTVHLDNFQVQLVAIASNSDHYEPRGDPWTLVAAFLSERRLFFDEAQAHFECEKMSISENPSIPSAWTLPVFRAEELKLTPEYERYYFPEQEILNPNRNLRPNFGVYNPFIHARPVSQCAECWGLPVGNPSSELQNFCYLFCISLSWHADLPIRQNEFPSWSYPGWERQNHQILWYLGGEFRPYEDLVDIKVELQNGEILSLGAFSRQYESIRRQLSKFIHITARTVRFRVKPLRERYTYQATASSRDGTILAFTFKSTVTLNAEGEECEGICLGIGKSGSVLLVCRKVVGGCFERIACGTLRGPKVYPEEVRLEPDREIQEGLLNALDENGQHSFRGWPSTKDYDFTGGTSCKTWSVGRFIEGSELKTMRLC